MIGRRSWNWPIWAGFVLTLLAAASYVLVFVRYPITRDVPWATYLLFVVSLIFLLVGLWRAFGRASLYRGKIAGSILTVLSVGLMALFSYGTLHGSRVPPSNDAPKVGENAPDFSLPDTHGNTVTLATLLASPQDSTGKPPRALLLVFYRGYWWPFCNSELRGIEHQLKEFEIAGVRPVAISVDTPAESANLCSKTGYTYTFLSDVGAQVIRRYNILHPGAGEDGKDIARPAEFLVDSKGVVRWVNLTNDFRVRATPEQMLDAIHNLN